MTSGVILIGYHLHPLIQHLSLVPVSLVRPECLAIKCQGSSDLYLSSSGITGACQQACHFTLDMGLELWTSCF